MALYVHNYLRVAFDVIAKLLILGASRDLIGSAEYAHAPYLIALISTSTIPPSLTMGLPL